MSRPLIRIHNTETDEILDREMNDEELATYEASKAAHAVITAELEAKVAARQAILDRLGLNQEEAKILLG
jgi:hypothetical protein